MLLVIDTSGPCCSTALYDLDAKAVVAEISENLGRGHAERLMPMLDELLSNTQQNWQNITRLGVINGPGSFTGLRVGLATARGLALALGVPCNTLSVFEAFDAELGDKGELGVVMDARRDQIWMQCFANGSALGEPQALATADVAEALPSSVNRLAGSAAAMVAERLGRGARIESGAPSPSIAAVAKRIADHAPAGHKPVALYLRAPDAKPQKPMGSNN